MYLHGVGDGEAGVGWGDLVLHKDDEQRRESDECDADEVQAHSQPAHGTAEEEVWCLVGIQKGLIPAGQGRASQVKVTCTERRGKKSHRRIRVCTHNNAGIFLQVEKSCVHTHTRSINIHIKVGGKKLGPLVYSLLPVRI